MRSWRITLFQPTLPPKGATFDSIDKIVNVIISTHAPTEGSDIMRSANGSGRWKFQPTLPPKGATLIHLERV